MAGIELNSVFLSASVPLEERDPIYFHTADVVAIRDAVRALASVVAPRATLVWGGHPSINPLIKYVMERLDANVQDHVKLFLSNFFQKYFPPEIASFGDITYVPENVDRESSLHEMRVRMIGSRPFKAGIFIGGMEGVEVEYEYFRQRHPTAKVFPIASTGAAAKIIYQRMETRPDVRLETDYAYLALFEALLQDLV